MESENPEEIRKWLAGVHLAQLGNLIIPLSGFVAVIVIWQAKKDRIPEMEAHGQMVMNWLISSIIYFAVCFILAFVLVGFFLMIILGLLSIGFAIYGAIKAYEGELWSYPLTIRFFT